MSPHRSSAWDTITLANESMQVVVAPDFGGKILSIRSQATGREWLWKNPHLPLRAPPREPVNYGDYDAGGWDEVFPSVDPCVVANSPWRERRIADHGELWRRPWRQVKLPTPRAAEHSLTLVVDEPQLPFRFERTLALSPGRGPLIADYLLTNQADAPLPYIWAAHPLLAIAPGMSIGLPLGTRVTAAACVGFELARRGKSFEWPIAELATGERLDLSRVPEPATKIAVKLFSDCLDAGWVTVSSENRDESLRISFDVDDVPYIGLWLNYGAWAGAETPPYFNCGVEPTTSPFDNLDNAVRSKQAASLEPGEVRRWRLAIEIVAMQR